MGSPDYLSYGFALLVLSGGVFGFVKKGSTMSLASGVAFGALIAYGATRTSTDPRDFLFLLIVSGGLFGVMAVRFYNSGKFMPAGLVSIISLAQVVRLSLRFMWFLFAPQKLYVVRPIHQQCGVVCCG